VSRVHDGILSTIGQTPLVRFRRAVPAWRGMLFAKLEGLNPGGSIKDRPALEIIDRARETGAIGPDTIVIESSSGNIGIGLAQVCAYHGLRFICVVDPKTTAQNLALLRAYGAEIDMVHEANAHGEYLETRIARVQALLQLMPDAYWPNQYANRWNVRSHATHTMPEIIAQVDGPIDYLFCATSTCGTITGCAEYLRDAGLPTRTIAVDAAGSVIFGGRKATRLIPGHGAAIRPALCDDTLIEACVHVPDADCILACRSLLRTEAVLAGGSSGAVLAAVAQMAATVPPDATAVVILPDRGERYLDTIYSDTWVASHFGNLLTEVRHWPAVPRGTTVTRTRIETPTF
jgi:cysteine synthase A